MKRRLQSLVVIAVLVLTALPGGVAAADASVDSSGLDSSGATCRLDGAATRHGRVENDAFKTRSTAHIHAVATCSANGSTSYVVQLVVTVQHRYPSTGTWEDAPGSRTCTYSSTMEGLQVANCDHSLAEQDFHARLPMRGRIQMLSPVTQTIFVYPPSLGST